MQQTLYSQRHLHLHLLSLAFPNLFTHVILISNPYPDTPLISLTPLFQIPFFPILLNVLHNPTLTPIPKLSTPYIVCAVYPILYVFEAVIMF